jgi:hypothetical protein
MRLGALIPAILGWLAVASASVAAQTPAAAAGAPDTTAFRCLDLPAPTSIRTASGAPGPDYWQQRVDYAIRATLDTATRSVRAEERITSQQQLPGHAPLSLAHLDQNVFNSEPRLPAVRPAEPVRDRQSRRRHADPQGGPAGVGCRAGAAPRWRPPSFPGW